MTLRTDESDAEALAGLVSDVDTALATLASFRDRFVSLLPPPPASAPSASPPPFDGTAVQFLDVPEDEYHAAARAGKYVSSHLLGLFRRSPVLLRAVWDGTARQPDSEAFAFGRAAHKLILEGQEAFGAAFTVADGPVNPKTGMPYGSETKAFREWAAAQSSPVISSRDYDAMTQMRWSVLRHDTAARLLSSGRAEGTIRTTWHGLQCQIRIDWFNPVEGIVDLKTCADIERFPLDARSFGYVHQLAFYRSILGEVFSVAANAPVHIIAVEKAEPFRCGVWRVEEDSLVKATIQNADAMGRLSHCLATGSWPTGWESVRSLSL